MPRPPRRLPAPRAVVVAPQPEAVEAGTDTLRAGGSAVDALVAVAMMQGVVDPLMCGIGGFGTIHVFDPDTGRHDVIDGMGTCPGAVSETMWAADFRGACSDGFGFMVRGHVNEIGRASVTTPGFVRALTTAHEAFGRLSWGTLIEPSIRVASDGWPVRPHVATMFTSDETIYGRLPFPERLRHTPDGARLYLRPDGTTRRVGEVIRNPDLAASLETLARDGGEALYTGALAERIVADQQANDGLLSADDLARYAPRHRAPLVVAYRGRDITLPPPPAGGIMIAQMLRILERFDLPALGHNSPGYIRVVAEAMKIAGREKDEFVGDPDLVELPVARMLSDTFADEAAAAIRAGVKASLPLALGDAKDTTTISVIDADGMVASCTHTLGTPSGVIPPGTGFMLNGAMNGYDPRPGRPGSIAPGKRRYSAMAPTIVLEGGRPVMTLGAPGGSWIGIAILQALLNVLDFGLSMQEAVEAPRFSATSDTIDIANRIPRATQRAVEAMGYVVARSPLTYPFAAVHGITMWDGTLEGGVDPQRDGYVGGVE